MREHTKTFTTALAGVVVGALLVGIVPAVAGTGDPFILGEKNEADKRTKLKVTGDKGPGLKITRKGDKGKALVLKGKGDKGPAAKIVRTTGKEAVKIVHRDGSPALNLRTTDGAAPIEVNSETMVEKLNSDTVDGLHSSGLQVLHAGDSSGDLDDGDGIKLTADLEVPTSGVLVMNAFADVFNGAVDDDGVRCQLRHGTPTPTAAIEGTLAIFEVNGAHGFNESENCATNGFMAVSAGTHRVELEFAFTDATTVLNDGTLSVLFIPTP